MPSVVVTGVSSGIGWGTASVLLQHGFQVFGSVRRPEDAVIPRLLPKRRVSALIAQNLGLKRP